MSKSGKPGHLFRTGRVVICRVEGNRQTAGCALSCRSRLAVGDLLHGDQGGVVSVQPLTVVWLRMAMASFLVLLVRKRIPAPRYEPGDWKVLVFCA